MSFKRLAKSMKRLGDEVVDAGVRRRRLVAIAIDQPLVTSTPVDTGAARSNWVVGLGAPRRDTISPLAKGRASTQLSITNAQSLVGASNSPEQPIFISNNLPYINRLNNGWSDQAPKLFIQRAIKLGIQVASQEPFLGRGRR